MALDIQELLRYVVDKKASDLHVKAGGPPYVRVNGTLSKSEFDALTAADCERAAMELMTDDHAFHLTPLDAPVLLTDALPPGDGRCLVVPGGVAVPKALLARRDAQAAADLLLGMNGEPAALTGAEATGLVGYGSDGRRR